MREIKYNQLRDDQKENKAKEIYESIILFKKTNNRCIN